MTAVEKRQQPRYFALYAQTIVANNFGILPVLPGRKKPRYKRWTTAGFKLPDPAWLQRHVEKYPTDSIGLGCGRVIGVDIDHLDAAMSHRIREAALEELGETSLIRIGQAPKQLLVYRTDDKIDTARSSAVEILARGSQFVALGLHPDTGQPYYWPDATPVDTDWADLPLVRRADLNRFLQRVSEIIGSELFAELGPPAANDNRPKRKLSAGSKPAVVRDAGGIVIDRREEFLRAVVWEEFQSGYRNPDELAKRAWSRFAAEADLSRPKGGRSSRRWSFRDALTRARHICRKQFAVRFPRSVGQERHLNSFRRPDYWTAERKGEHQIEAARRAMTPAALMVNKHMLDASPISAGQCIATVSVLMTQTSLSESSVKTARRILRDVGLWISERGVYVPMPLNETDEDNEPSTQGSAGGANGADPFIRSVGPPAPSVDRLDQPPSAGGAYERQTSPSTRSRERAAACSIFPSTRSERRERQVRRSRRRSGMTISARAVKC